MLRTHLCSCEPWACAQRRKFVLSITYGTVHMPTAHMSTDGCEALSAIIFSIFRDWNSKHRKRNDSKTGTNFFLKTILLFDSTAEGASHHLKHVT